MAVSMIAEGSIANHHLSLSVEHYGTYDSESQEFRALMWDNGVRIWASPKLPSFNAAERIGRHHYQLVIDRMLIEWSLVLTVEELDGPTPAYRAVIANGDNEVVWTSRIMPSYNSARQLGLHHKALVLDRLRPTYEKG